MKMSRAVRERFRAYGREGGRARSAAMSPERRRTVARQASLRRWIRNRFGAATFESLRLPGGDFIDAGLTDLAARRESPGSLAISEAAPRLRREGVPVPEPVFENAALRLYRLLETAHGDLAHARYLACLRQVSAFADACARARKSRGRHA